MTGTMKTNDKHIWEGWTVQCFIDELTPLFNYQPKMNNAELKEWVKSNQPYYKKHIPEVYIHFKTLNDKKNEYTNNIW